jgi:hypothetical protein
MLCMQVKLRHAEVWGGCGLQSEPWVQHMEGMRHIASAGHNHSTVGNPAQYSLINSTVQCAAERSTPVPLTVLCC